MSKSDQTLRIRGSSLRKGIYFEKAEMHLKKAKYCIFESFGDCDHASSQLCDAAKNFINAKLWHEAGLAYITAAKCHLMMDWEATAACFYADAAWCYKNIDIDESLSLLYRAQSLFLKTGDNEKIAWCYKNMADVYETKQNTEQAIVYYERAVSLYQSINVVDSAILCQLKIAKLAAILEQYKKAVEIFTMMAYMETKVESYGFREHLLDAGICQLCEGKGEAHQMKAAFKEYQEINSSFRETQEYRLLAGLVDAIDHQDVEKFVDAEVKFSIATMKLDPWRATLLSRALQAIKQ